MLEWHRRAVEHAAVPKECRAFANRFMSATPSERREVVEVWDSRVSWGWPNPWRLACVGGEMGTPEERIRACVLQHALHLSTADTDDRDELIGLAIEYNSARLAGVDPDAVFSDIAGMFEGRAKDMLTAFVKRAPEDKAMEAFWLEALPQVGGGAEIRIRHQ